MSFIEDILNMVGGEGAGTISAPNVDLPTLLQINPELYQVAAEMSPELVSNVNLGPSAMEGISLDPRTRAAQTDALDKLINISNAGGKDAQFLADSSRLQNDINANLKSNADAIQQNMAMKGLSGGMSELVARNLNAQQGANRQAQMGLDINAQAQQRALDALMNSANLGANMENQQFNQQSNIAKSKDMINQWNAENLQAARNANVGAINEARGYNVRNRQDVANNNTGVRNTAQEYNLNIPQQQFNNQMQRAGLQQQANMANAENKEKRRGQNLGFFGGALSAGAQAFGGGK